ncbi:radical SAM protein [Natranaerobius trueperi]|uniref:Radical SAM protein n=1 Tax=Natranaerobius trueperi TaxID=759412 RepID=A0A226BX30_9FIRM|nr:radical SAM protein [Natranaerobius trueperi]OWZ83573.1 radical SAM protein [Natranaerobius trueperi]
MNYVYGPINSRRLGTSLGINITPDRDCSLDCIYCEEGLPTQNLTLSRKEYTITDNIIDQIYNKVESLPTSLDYITFSGSGEPTLHNKLGTMIKKIKALNIPIAVITNSTLIHLEEVQEDLIYADLVIPSLDAITQKTLHQVNRPHPEIKIHNIKNGLEKFSHKFLGQIWLEILLVSGVNDSYEELTQLSKFVNNYILVDKVQLNTISRTTTLPGAFPVASNKLQKISDLFTAPVEIFC